MPSSKTREGSPNGALREAEAAEVTIGVEAGDLDATLARGVELGGSIVMPPTDNGSVNKARIADPAGNVVTVIASDKSAAAI